MTQTAVMRGAFSIRDYWITLQLEPLPHGGYLYTQYNH